MTAPALRALEASGGVRQALGDAFVDRYLRRLEARGRYESSADLTPWERTHTRRLS